MNHTAAAAHAHNNWLTWTVVVALFAMILPNVYFREVLLRVDYISVQDAVEGNRIPMSASRSFYGSWRGTKSVSIIDASGSPACEPPSRRMASQREANPMPEPLYLDWWIGGLWSMRDCEQQGMGPGVYVLETCYLWVGPYGVQLAQQCHESNRFTIRGRNADSP